MTQDSGRWFPDGIEGAFVLRAEDGSAGHCEDERKWRHAGWEFVSRLSEAVSYRIVATSGPGHAAMMAAHRVDNGMVF